MSMSDNQFEFLKDVAVLIQYITRCGDKVTGGELWRPNEMQELYLQMGKTKAKISNHQIRMAIDLNIFIGGTLCYDKKKLQKYGDFWESMNKKNRWGGNFKSFLDVPHFERRT